MKTRYAEVPGYQTKDGSEIRELMHPGTHAYGRQSLAEAIVRPGQQTLLHRHRESEELYHITAGRGLMTLGDQTFNVATGDTIRMLPGTPHCLENNGDIPLHILCFCCPAYSHEDTELIANFGSSS